MKKMVLACFIILVSYFLGFGQQIFIQFEPDTLNNSDYKKYFYLDSNNVDNIWQVGKPNKAIFDSAFTIPNALVTDTVNTYPINNTSSVMFWNIVSLGPACDVLFKYKINSDTLTDYGKVEVSGNSGITWTEITYWVGSPPVFSGNSNGWTGAFFEFGPNYLFNSQPGDTILFKFTFTSDGIETHKDGWMIDNIIVTYNAGIGISEPTNKQNSFQISYHGNNEIEVIMQDYETLKNYQIQFFNIMGRQVYLSEFESKKSNVFHLPNLAKGIYLYQVSCENQLEQSGKIVIIR